PNEPTASEIRSHTRVLEPRVDGSSGVGGRVTSLHTKPTRRKKAGNAIAGMYRLNPGKYGYENPVPSTSPIAPSPANNAPRASTINASVIAYSESPVTMPISQKIARAVRNAATAPDIVIAHGVEIPRMHAGIATVYGPAN